MRVQCTASMVQLTHAYIQNSYSDSYKKTLTLNLTFMTLEPKITLFD